MTDRKGAAIPCGGDDDNYYMFYLGNCYEHNNIDNVVEFARSKFDSMKNMSDEEIKNKHIFWATDSARFEDNYNGDVYVLFDDADKLPEFKQKDAYRECKLNTAIKGRGDEFAISSETTDDSYDFGQ